ncbi:MAG: hypothetical protein LBU32_20695 [Clostridiales bacterium]|jgi:hypothetical protein|nr:hypothetical protein [Clostridiales bacterium]
MDNREYRLGQKRLLAPLDIERRDIVKAMHPARLKALPGVVSLMIKQGGSWFQVLCLPCVSTAVIMASDLQ